MARIRNLTQRIKGATKTKKQSAHAPAINTKTEQPCTGYCCSAYMKFEEPLLTKDAADLQNPVHPIFREQNFPAESDQFRRWPIEMALCLASLLLESDVLVPSINIMAQGDLRFANGPKKGQLIATPAELWKPKDAPGEYWAGRESARYPKPGQEEVNDSTRLNAKLILAHLTDMVDFAILDGEHVGEEGARCQIIEGPLDAKSAKVFPWGCRTRIQIMRQTYTNLGSYAIYSGFHGKWHESDDWDTDHILENLLARRFKFAVTVVHELAHALGHAAIGSISAEPYYQDSILSEAGYDVENILFGGTINSDHGVAPSHRGTTAKFVVKDLPFYVVGRQKTFLTIEEYPSPGLLLQYWHDGMPFVKREGAVLPAFDVAWRIPRASIEELFTSNYWASEDLRHHGLCGPLKLPRTIGWIFDPDDTGTLWPIPGGDPTLPRMAQRAAKKRRRSEPEELRRDGECDVDWAKIIEGLDAAWPKLFDSRTATQRKRERRKAARADVVDLSK
ncbi:hypothetical protein LTR85_011699 [Meristemomyces frigidus]|nr:hypothetical protein LTR85_011699 [Meristemomyces frigidus]